jgi:accessory gene regulator protein AgrB
MNIFQFDIFIWDITKVIVMKKLTILHSLINIVLKIHYDHIPIRYFYLGYHKSNSYEKVNNFTLIY